MKKLLLLKSLLLLCALIVGSSAWAQTDYSATHTSGVTLSGGSSCKVVISSTQYDGTKLGSSGNGGSCTFSAPSGTKYIHIHVAAWKAKNPTFSYKVGSGSATNISITSDDGVSNNSPFTLSNQSKATTDYYKVVTLGDALATATTITLASTDERVVIWGVNTEAVSSDPSSNAAFANTTPSITYPATKTYSQAPTTAAGYSGTITYSITANTAGATINSSTGLVTVTQGGSVTVKAIAAAVPGSFSGSEASYILTVGDTRTENPGLTWSAASASVKYGAVNSFPILTNTHDVEVSYTSSDQSAATINGSGVITLKNVSKNTTISAVFAGDDTYLPQTVTYTLNVNYGIEDGKFDFVNAAAASPLEDFGSGVTLTSSAYTTGSKTWTAGNVTMVTADGGGSGIRWWSADGTLRFYSSGTATFTVPSGYVITKIVTTGASFDSSSPSGLSGSTWTGASNEVKLTATAGHNIKTITVTYTTATQSETVQSYGWATYIPNFNVQFADNTAYVVTAASVSEGLTLAPVTQVPAGTPVLLKGAGTKNITVIASADAPATNLLTVSNGSALSAGSYPYVLAKNGEGACFKQWTGAMSTLNGRVMLVLDEAVATARGIFELDDETTGVAEVRSKMTDGRSEYFNLAGQRVAQPTKGLYIVNGKKVIIK